MFKKREPKRDSMLLSENDNESQSNGNGKTSQTGRYSLFGDGPSPTASKPMPLGRASVSGTKPDNEITPAQRMAMTRRRYSIMNLDSVKRMTSSWATKAKKKVEENKSPLLRVQRTSEGGFPMIVMMEDVSIRKDK